MYCHDVIISVLSVAVLSRAIEAAERSRSHRAPLRYFAQKEHDDDWHLRKLNNK